MFENKEQTVAFKKALEAVKAAIKEEEAKATEKKNKWSKHKLGNMLTDLDEFWTDKIVPKVMVFFADSLGTATEAPKEEAPAKAGQGQTTKSK